MKQIIIIVLLFLSIVSFKSDLASETSKSFYIEVYYDVYLMRVWEIYKHDNTIKKILVGNYPVTLTWKKYNLPKKALITNVELNPVWRPTAGVKKRYFKKYGKHLKNEYGPGERMNAMGAFKWTLKFVNETGYYKGDNATRVHEEKNPSRIGKRVSSGCVRLLKKDGIFLTKLLWGYKRVMVYTTLNSPS